MPMSSSPDSADQHREKLSACSTENVSRRGRRRKVPPEYDVDVSDVDSDSQSKDTKRKHTKGKPASTYSGNVPAFLRKTFEVSSKIPLCEFFPK